MSKFVFIVSLIAVAIIFALIGGAVTLSMVKSSPEQQKNEEAVDLILSKTISSITAMGKITAKDGRNITISNLGEEITVLISDNKPVYTLKTEDGKQKKVAFDDIQIGDSVSVGLKINADKQLEGQSVMIFPEQ